MRVLLLHNSYRLPGGEERAVRDTAAMLRRRGHVVEILERSSAGTGRRQAAGAMLRGGQDPGEVARAVERLRADIVHAHNLHPLFGWRALAAARAAGARTVLHLHNYRLFCAIGIAYRDGQPCFRCRGANTLPGLQLRCRGSAAEAAVYAAGLSRQQPRIFEHVDRFIALSDASRTLLRQLGLPPGVSSTLPNFIPDDEVAAASAAGQGEYMLASGRLVAEKGFDTAVTAARVAGVPLVVAGAGPDEARLRGLAAGGEVHFPGMLAPARMADVRARAAAALVPSRWEEPCPYTALEALATGLPLLASDIGGLPELAGGEGVIPAGDPAAWARSLAELWGDPGARRERGERALARLREHYGEHQYYERLIEIYLQALA